MIVIPFAAPQRSLMDELRLQQRVLPTGTRRVRITAHGIPAISALAADRVGRPYMGEFLWDIPQLQMLTSDWLRLYCLLTVAGRINIMIETHEDEWYLHLIHARLLSFAPEQPLSQERVVTLSRFCCHGMSSYVQRNLTRDQL